MKKLPKVLTFKKQTPDFDESNVPAGILSEHKTAVGIWGKLVVTEGSLTYRILEPDVEEHQLTTANYGVVAPEMAHQVEINGPVKFHIEFYRHAA